MKLNCIHFGITQPNASVSVAFPSSCFSIILDFNNFCTFTKNSHYTLAKISQMLFVSFFCVDFSEKRQHRAPSSNRFYEGREMKGSQEEKLLAKVVVAEKRWCSN